MNINGWKLAKYLLYGFLGLILLIALLLLFTQTGIFKSWLKEKIENGANSSLNGKLSIGFLHGNLFTHTSLDNIVLTNDSDTIIKIDRIALGYNIMGLLSGNIEIDSLIISSPALHAVQNDSGMWNFQNLVAGGGSSKSTDSTGGTGYDITLSRFGIYDGSVIIRTADTLIPKIIDSLNILLNLQYHEPDYRLNLDSLSFYIVGPGLKMKNTAMALTGNDNQVALEKLSIKTAMNYFHATGIYYFERGRDTEFDFKTDSLYLVEFSPFVSGLPTDIHPLLQTNLNLDKDSLNLDIGIDGRGYKIETTGFLKGLLKYMQDSTAVLSYGLNTNVENINLAKFIDDTTMQSSINGNLAVNGFGVAPESAQIKASLHLDQSNIRQNEIKSFSTKFDYRKGEGSGNLSLETAYGTASIKFEGKNLLGTPRITADAQIDHFDLAGFVPGQESSDLNLTFNAVTTGSDPDSMTADILLNIGKSTYGTVQIDTVTARLKVSPGVYHVDTLFARSAKTSLKASGEINDRRDTQVDYLLNIGDLAYINNFVDSLDIGGSADISGTVSGRPDSLLVSASVDGKNIYYDTYTIDRLTGENEIKLYPKRTEITGKSSVEKLFISDNIKGSSQLEYSATPDSADIILDSDLGDSVKVHLESSIKFDSLLKIYLSDLVVDLKDQRWHSAYDPTNIVIDSETVSIDSLLLLSDGTSPSKKQRLRLAGRYSTSGPINLALTAKNIDLSVISGFASLPDKFGGLLDYSLDMNGTAIYPKINSGLTLTGVNYNDFVISKTSGHLIYDTSGMDIDLEVIPSDVNSFKVSGNLPVDINLAEMTYRFDKAAPFKMDVVSNRFPLQTISRVSGTVDNIEGVINTEIHASNTFNNPSIKGNISITGRNLQIPRYGIAFNRFGSQLTFKDDRAVLDSMIFLRDKGSLLLKGDIKFGGGILEGNISATQFDLRANDIYLVKQKYYQIQIAGDVRLTSDADTANYSGNIKVLRSNFYLPALMKEYGNGSGSEPQSRPMLVKAAGRDTVKTIDTTAAAAPSVSDSTYRVFEGFMDRLQGKMNISFPRNTWIRSPDLRMELSGDLDIVKEGPEFEIFGSVSIVRGHYDLYGKRFNIKEGKLTFQGGPEMNPNIDLEAAYSFRTPSREKKTLTLIASGTALSPELSFQLDGQAISEGDAASYIVFGRSLNELTYGQRSGLVGGSASGNGEGSFAKGVAANFLSNQLAKALGSELSLDVIEINASNDWQSASFVVGKYITNDLFVSYQRDVGEVQNNDVTPETVTLEYELTKRIFLQLIEGNSTDSGFDIFFKFQRE